MSELTTEQSSRERLHGFSREDLEAIADGLAGYERTVNVGNVTGEGDSLLESTTAAAARFIRSALSGSAESGPVAPNLGDGYEPTMNIHATPGTKVRFRAGGGYPYEGKHAEEAGFVKNEVYTVKRCDIGHSKTEVLFDELPGRWNSALFADIALPAQAVGVVTDAMRKAFDDRNNSLEADERDGIIAAILALAAPMPQPEGETSGCMANEAAYGEAGNPVIDELTDFVVSRWHAEVKNRPLVNKNRRPLDDAWRQILRHLGVDDRARLGPTHDELLEGFE